MKTPYEHSRPKMVMQYSYACSICGVPVVKCAKTIVPSCFACKQARKRQKALDYYQETRKKK